MNEAASRHPMARFPLLRTIVRRVGIAAAAAVIAMSAAGVLLLWSSQLPGLDLSVNPDALLPQIDPTGEAASAARPGCRGS